MHIHIHTHIAIHHMHTRCLKEYTPLINIYVYLPIHTYTHI